MLVSTLAGLLTAATPQEPVPEPMPAPRALVFARGDTSITIDGKLEDWPIVPAIRLDDTRQISGTALGAYLGAADLNATAFMLWDADAVYFAAKVLDDVHLELTDETLRIVELPPTDSITLTFDPRRDTRAFGADPGRGEDSAHWLGDTDADVDVVFRQDRLRGTARIADGARIAVVRDPTAAITTYEVRIPWREVLPDEITAAADTVLDLQIVVDDYDVPGVPLPDSRIGWTFGTGARIDPGLFGSIRLSSRVAGSDRAFDLPEFPPPPEGAPEDPVPGRAYWIDLHDRLAGLPPAVATAAIADPEFAGGEERRRWLAALDLHHSRFPRVDFVQFQICIQRRMVRECAGVIDTGLPFYWDHVLGRVAREALRDAPERGFRLVRLPHGGWLVRSKTASFLIDPAGFGVEKPNRLWDWCDFVLLTEPGDIFARNDQLLVRMAVAKPERRIFAHVEQYLPGVPQGLVARVVPGESYAVRGLEVTVVGVVDERGWVTRSVGYHVGWPDGTTLVVSGTDSLAESLPKGPAPDVLILSADHPRARVFGERVGARLTVLDEVLECATIPGPAGRVPLDDAWALQRALRPRPSLLLAPGESFESVDVPE